MSLVPSSLFRPDSNHLSTKFPIPSDSNPSKKIPLKIHNSSLWNCEKILKLQKEEGFPNHIDPNTLSKVWDSTDPHLPPTIAPDFYSKTTPQFLHTTPKVPK